MCFNSPLFDYLGLRDGCPGGEHLEWSPPRERGVLLSWEEVSLRRLAGRSGVAAGVLLGAGGPQLVPLPAGGVVLGAVEMVSLSAAACVWSAPVCGQPGCVV